MKLFMTDGEIITSFKQAKNKQTQVGVLAELNGCTRSAMRTKLAALGLIDPPAPAPAPEKKEEPSFDWDKAREMFASGASDKEIAQALGCSAWRVGKWRSAENLIRKSGNPRRCRIPESEARAMIAAGKTDTEVAEAFGMTRAAIASWRRRNGIPGQPTSRRRSLDEEAAMALLQEGKTDAEIAQALGVRVRRVQDWRTDKGYWRPSGQKNPAKAGVVLPIEPRPLREKDVTEPLVFHGKLAGMSVKVTIEIGGGS